MFSPSESPLGVSDDSFVISCFLFASSLSLKTLMYRLTISSLCFLTSVVLGLPSFFVPSAFSPMWKAANPQFFSVVFLNKVSYLLYVTLSPSPLNHLHWMFSATTLQSSGFAFSGNIYPCWRHRSALLLSSGVMPFAIRSSFLLVSSAKTRAFSAATALWFDSISFSSLSVDLLEDDSKPELCLLEEENVLLDKVDLELLDEELLEEGGEPLDEALLVEVDELLDEELLDEDVEPFDEELLDEDVEPLDESLPVEDVEPFDEALPVEDVEPFDEVLLVEELLDEDVDELLDEAPLEECVKLLVSFSCSGSESELAPRKNTSNGSPSDSWFEKVSSSCSRLSCCKGGVSGCLTSSSPLVVSRLREGPPSLLFERSFCLFLRSLLLERRSLLSFLLSLFSFLRYE